jgi:hypothetical protein
MMMKWINRIVYALIVALGMMLVFNIVDSQVRSNVLQEQGLQAIQDGDYDRLLAVRFYHTEKLVDTQFTIGDATFDLYLYDAAFVREEAGVLVVYGGITALFHQTGGKTLTEPFLIRYQAGEEALTLHMGFQVLKLPIYSGVDPETLSAVILKEDLNSPLTQFQLVKDETVLVSVPIDIESADLTVQQALSDYIDEHGTVPKEPFDQVGITPTVAIDTSLHVVFFAALYLIAVAITTYLFFVWKKQKLGRVKPTEGVLRDIEHISRKEGR